MAMATDNIEPPPRAISERGQPSAGWLEVEVQRSVKRYWHCVAAEI